MQPEFWHERWSSNQIGFHEGKPNDDLVAFWSTLELPPHARVLVPLCGKSHDLGWLRSQGHEVVGVELSEIACEAFFEEQGLKPTVAPAGAYTAWSVPGLTILQGDFFDLPTDEPFDAVWDRAATVALPDDLRERYAKKLAELVRPGGRMLLSVFDYPQTQRAGPPFSVPPVMVEALYAEHFTIQALQKVDAIQPDLDLYGVTWWVTGVYGLQR